MLAGLPLFQVSYGSYDRRIDREAAGAAVHVVSLFGEPNDVVNPGVDWSIALNGVGPGQSFGILLQPTAAAPEPTTLALLGTAAVVGLGVDWRRRRRRMTTFRGSDQVNVQRVRLG